MKERKKENLMNVKVKPIHFTSSSRFAFKMYTRYLLLDKNNKTEKQKYGQWLTDNILELGPVYTKLGQFASSRPDFFDKDIIKPLESLQDSLPVEDFTQLITSEIGTKITDLEKVPIGRASIAQVYKATSKRTNKKIAIKVQRPNMKKIFDRDLKNIEIILVIFKILRVSGTENLSELLRECRPVLYKEIDFKSERQNADRFKKSLEMFDWIQVPKVYYASDNLIVSEYIQGTKITEITKNKKEVTTKLLLCFLIQILQTGLVHGDVQPGNISVSSEGNLIWYDFGVVSDITHIRHHFWDIGQVLLVGDIDDILDILEKMEVMTPTAKRSKLKKSIIHYIEYIKTMDLKKLKNSVQNGTFKELETMLKLDATYIYLFRSFTMVEGICKSLDPNFNYMNYYESIKTMIPGVEMIFSSIRNMSVSQRNLRTVKSIVDESLEENQSTQKNMKLILILVVVQSIGLLTFMIN